MVSRREETVPVAVQDARDAVYDGYAVRVDLVRHVLELLDTGKVRLGEMIRQVNLMFSEDVHRESIRVLQNTMRLRRFGHVE